MNERLKVTGLAALLSAFCIGIPAYASADKGHLSQRSAVNDSGKSAAQEWHYLLGWGNNALTAGAGYSIDLSSGGFWRAETSFYTVIGDETLGAKTNAYSANLLVTLNFDLFGRLRLTLKGGPAIRHVGLGVQAVNEYYNYGAAILLDLDTRGSYGIYYYPDLIGFSYISRF